MLASALFLRAVGPATVLPHKCDILSLLKDDQIVRDNCLPVHCRHLASRRHRTAIPVATQMSLPAVCLPPFSTCPMNIRSEKSQNKSSPNFSNFCPGFCPEFLSEFSPNFFSCFVLWEWRSEKTHQKFPPFFNEKFPGKYEEIFTNILWRGGKVTEHCEQKTLENKEHIILVNPFLRFTKTTGFCTKIRVLRAGFHK